MPRDPQPRWRARLGVWRFRFQGREHYKKLGGPKDWAGAAAWARSIADGAEAEQRRWAAPTVGDLADWFLHWHVTNGSAAKTVEQYADMLGKFRAIVGEGKRADEVAPADLKRADAQLRRAGLGATRYHLAKVVLGCWNWAARPEPDREAPDGRPLAERLLAANPLAGCKPPMVPAETERVATRRDVAELLRFARREVEGAWKPGTKGRCITCTKAGREGPCRRSHDSARALARGTLVLVRVAAAIGCRPGELCGARWEDWEPRAARDAAGHWWGILKVVHKTRKLKGRKRPLVIPPPLARAIERIRARPGRHPIHLFAHRRGKGSGTVGSPSAGSPWNVTALGYKIRKWREAAREAGYMIPADFTAYSMRHGYFTDTAPVIGSTAAAMLGGNSAAIVERVYLHKKAPGLVRQAAAARSAVRRTSTPHPAGEGPPASRKRAG